MLTSNNGMNLHDHCETTESSDINNREALDVDMGFEVFSRVYNFYGV